MRPTQATRIRRLASYVLSAFLLCELLIVTVVRAQPKVAPKNSAVVAQQKRGTGRGPSPSATPARNPQISKIVTEIDPRNIERTIRKLVSFGTRNTLSEQNDPNRGIGAARDWLYAEFQQAAAQSGGRMTVEKQTFEQAEGGARAAANDADERRGDVEGHPTRISQSSLCRQRSLRFDVFKSLRCKVRRAGR